MTQEPSARILLAISCYSSVHTGRGGHYYTVRDLAIAFTKAWPAASIDILVVGDVFPAPFRNDRLTVSFIDFKGISPVTLIKEVLAYGDRLRPTHVHSFDNKAHFFGRWIARRTGARIYLTRPGGPNRRTFFPFSPHIVCFSEENLHYLQGRRNLKETKFHLLPQRVLKPVEDPSRIEALRRIIGNRKIVLRICRIGKYYESSINQTLALTRELRLRGMTVSAVIIGFIQDREVYDDLQRKVGPYDYIITDPWLTENASQVIGVAEAVVGTGRSLVEAALLGKVLLTPLADAELPVLVTDSNWRALSKTNFSERNRMNDPIPSLDEVTRSIISADTAGADAVGNEMGIAHALACYADIYCQPQVGRPRRIDFMLNAAPVVLQYGKTRGNQVLQSVSSRRTERELRCEAHDHNVS